jgi:hypothetical protein
MDTDINDKEFAERAAQELIAMIENKWGGEKWIGKVYWKVLEKG